MNIRILITLLFGVTLFCSCQPKQLPVNSLAERVTEGTSKDRILFRMTPEKDDVSKDYFEITAEDGKVLIVGNSDLSLATGLNWYLKYVAGIHLSWNNPSQKVAGSAPSSHGENPSGDSYAKPLLSELLYLFLLNGFLGLGTLGEGD